MRVVARADDHCWVGEFNGAVGWFPARFVQLLEEGRVEYSRAGDDRVGGAVAELARVGVGTAVGRLLQQGLRPPGILATTPLHPWHFIQRAARELLPPAQSALTSRLSLAAAFSLEQRTEESTTPEQLLGRAVARVEATHSLAGAGPDVKLRSLVCLGLNHQCLHLWLGALARAARAVSQCYSPTALLASPAWMLVQSELRPLAQFYFQLSEDWELTGRRDDNTSLYDGVLDMLAKHHLFSWNTG